MKTETIDDGGTAFPIPWGQVMSDAGKGMSLRDWFAGRALTGLLSNHLCKGTIERYCRDSYRYADAMILARKGGAK